MKFSKFIVLLSSALAAVVAAVSCQKEEGSASVPEPSGKVELCITGDFNDFDGLDTKASIENIFRMTWAENDKVYVFGKASGADVFSCLGTLTATPDSETGNRVADLTGTITAPKADTKLTLVYSPVLSAAPSVSDGAISIDLSTQSGKASDVTFVAYTAVDYKNDESATYRTSFSFATSVLRVNVSGLAASTALTNATLGTIETKCKLTFAENDAPTVAGENSTGTLTRTFTSVSSNAKGYAAFYIAVPTITANADRALIVTQSGNEYGANGFAAGQKSAGNMMNSIAPVKELIVTDLSENGTANSYIVSTLGRYKFKTVKGNSSTSVGTVSTASVLWESYGTDTAPSVGDLINAFVSYADNYITFSTNYTYKKGNALIAAKDGSGNILWSWHIWLTDKPGDKVEKNIGTMMDRNLGAISAGAGDDGSCGLLYQWGRKDPFIGGSGKTTLATSYPSNPADIKSASACLSGGTNTLAYSIANPTTFISNNQDPTDWNSTRDWYCTSPSDKNDNLWKNASDSPKTIYDPCPVGYRVPDYNVLPLSGGYPAAGYRKNSDGSLSNVGIDGYYWSCTPTRNSAWYWPSTYTATSSTCRADGQSVRCLSGSK